MEKLWSIINEMEYNGEIVAMPDEELKDIFYQRAIMEGIKEEEIEKFLKENPTALG